jgi:hypothetical protein
MDTRYRSIDHRAPNTEHTGHTTSHAHSDIPLQLNYGKRDAHFAINIVPLATVYRAYNPVQSYLQCTETTVLVFTHYSREVTVEFELR